MAELAGAGSKTEIASAGSKINGHTVGYGEGVHYAAYGEKKSSAIVSGDTNLAKTKVLLIDSGKPYFVVKIEPYSGGYSITNEKKHNGGMNALVTAVNLAKASRSQVNYTIGKTVYIYTLGEALYNLTIGGFGFVPCDSGDASTTFSDLVGFYDSSNIGKTGRYCTITLGSRTFAGYLTQADMGITNESCGVMGFKFTFLGVFL